MKDDSSPVIAVPNGLATMSSISLSTSCPMLLIFEQPDHPIVMWSEPIV